MTASDSYSGALAATLLLQRIDAVAAAVTDVLYSQRPELHSRHGASGREKCLQDMHFNIEHLAAAVDLDAPEMFHDYTVWLEGLLRARNVATGDLLFAFQLLESMLAHELPADASGPIIRVLQSGIRVLSAQPA